MLQCLFTSTRTHAHTHTHRSKVGLPGKTEGAIFTPLECKVVYFDPERVGVEMLQQVKQDSDGVAPIISDFVRIERWGCVCVCVCVHVQLLTSAERQSPLTRCWTSCWSMWMMSL